MADSTQQQALRCKVLRLRRILYVLAFLTVVGVITHAVCLMMSAKIGRWVILTMYGTMACLIGFLGFLLAHKDYARRLKHAGLCRCRSCSYDLTGNISGVCPECGTEIETLQR